MNTPVERGPTKERTITARVVFSTELPNGTYQSVELSAKVRVVPEDDEEDIAEEDLAKAQASLQQQLLAQIQELQRRALEDFLNGKSNGDQ